MKLSRFYLILLCTLVTLPTQASTWYVKNIHTGNVVADFEYIEEGKTPEIDIGQGLIYYESVNTYLVDGAWDIPTFERSSGYRDWTGYGGADFLFMFIGGASGFGTPNLSIAFESALPSAGGTVGIQLLEENLLGGQCNSWHCWSGNADDYVATTIPPVPLPAAGWLFVSALGAIGLLKRRNKAA